MIQLLDFSFFSGGFIGVDVFFVISGYLITKNILLEKNKSGSFSFKYFYQRRVLRLAPAFFTVLSICSIAFYFILTPEKWIEDLKRAAATVTLTSNIDYNTLLKDYFSISGKSTPLLHIWSLSLEEQFYLIWPLLLLGIIQLSRNFKIFKTIDYRRKRKGIHQLTRHIWLRLLYKSLHPYLNTLRYGKHQICRNVRCNQKKPNTR